MTYYISARTAAGLVGFYVDDCDSFARAFELGEAKLSSRYRGPFVILSAQRMPDFGEGDFVGTDWTAFVEVKEVEK